MQDAFVKRLDHFFDVGASSGEHNSYSSISAEKLLQNGQRTFIPGDYVDPRLLPDPEPFLDSSRLPLRRHPDEVR